MKATKSKRDPTNKAESETIVVEMTREQAYAVMNACELLARLEIGQFKEIVWNFIDKFHTADNKFDSVSREDADALAEQLCKKIFGTNKYGWPNIDKKSIRHQRCWAVYSTIRYVLAWHDHPEGGNTVNFNEPLGYGEKMPKCRIEGGDGS